MGACFNHNPHISQHLRSATLCSFMVFLWHPGPVPTLDLCGRLQIASLIRRTVPRCPHSLLCRWHTPPLFTPTPVTSLKPLCRAPSVTSANHSLAACESEVPCALCCTSIGLDLRTCSLSPSLLMLHSNRHPCLFTEHTEERANWPFICKPPKFPPLKAARQRISTSYQLALLTPLSP